MHRRAGHRFLPTHDEVCLDDTASNHENDTGNCGLPSSRGRSDPRADTHRVRREHLRSNCLASFTIHTHAEATVVLGVVLCASSAIPTRDEPNVLGFAHYRSGGNGLMRDLLVTIGFLSLSLISLEAQTSQPAASFAELPRVLQADSLVVLTLVSRERVQGLVDAVEPARLSICERDRVRWIREADIARIDRRTPDSIANGLLIGAAVGASIFLKYYSENALCEYNCQFASGALALVGIGAGVGTAIDALVVRTTTVYERRNAELRGVILLGVNNGGSRSVGFRLIF